MTARIGPDHDGLAGRADDVYEALLAAHEGLSEAESAALNARLILLLCNALNDPDLALAIINAARCRVAPADETVPALAVMMPSKSR